MQVIKGSSTLRVGPKPLNPDGFKPPPRVIFRYGRQDGAVRTFLANKRRLLRMLRRLGKVEVAKV